ncbi:uncharacterized protein V6R79_022558 [Siganus canaliculatus]
MLIWTSGGSLRQHRTCGFKATTKNGIALRASTLWMVYFKTRKMPFFKENIMVTLAYPYQSHHDMQTNMFQMNCKYVQSEMGGECDDAFYSVFIYINMQTFSFSANCPFLHEGETLVYNVVESHRRHCPKLNCAPVRLLHPLTHYWRKTRWLLKTNKAIDIKGSEYNKVWKKEPRLFPQRKSTDDDPAALPQSEKDMFKSIKVYSKRSERFSQITVVTAAFSKEKVVRLDESYETVHMSQEQQHVHNYSIHDWGFFLFGTQKSNKGRVYLGSESSAYFIFCHLFHEINDITTTRSVVLQCLPLHLGDTSSKFFLSSSDADSTSDSRQVPFGVLRVLTEATPPELGSIALILKRNIVIDGIPSTSQALCLLFSIWITPKLFISSAVSNMCFGNEAGKQRPTFGIIVLKSTFSKVLFLPDLTKITAFNFQPAFHSKSKALHDSFCGDPPLTVYRAMSSIFSLIAAVSRQIPAGSSSPNSVRRTDYWQWSGNTDKLSIQQIAPAARKVDSDETNISTRDFLISYENLLRKTYVSVYQHRRRDVH